MGTAIKTICCSRNLSIDPNKKNVTCYSCILSVAYVLLYVTGLWIASWGFNLAPIWEESLFLPSTIILSILLYYYSTLFWLARYFVYGSVLLRATNWSYRGDMFAQNNIRWLSMSHKQLRTWEKNKYCLESLVWVLLN